MRRLAVAILLLLISCPAAGQNRVKRRAEVQLNFGPLLHAPLGRTTADESLAELTTDTWRPGITIGMHVSSLLFVGTSYYPSTSLTRTGTSAFADGTTGTIELEYVTGSMPNVFFRLTPFRLGFYVSAGYVFTSQAGYLIRAEPADSTYRIGATDYSIPIGLYWNSQKSNGLGAGAGYNMVLKNGLSFHVGFFTPIAKRSDAVTNLNVGVDKKVFKPSDVPGLRVVAANATFHTPIVYYLNVGYNFRI